MLIRDSGWAVLAATAFMACCWQAAWGDWRQTAERRARLGAVVPAPTDHPARTP